jgi:hypothetical protein
MSWVEFSPADNIDVGFSRGSRAHRISLRFSPLVKEVTEVRVLPIASTLSPQVRAVSDAILLTDDL